MKYIKTLLSWKTLIRHRRSSKGRSGGQDKDIELHPLTSNLAQKRCIILSTSPGNLLKDENRFLTWGPKEPHGGIWIYFWHINCCFYDNRLRIPSPTSKNTTSTKRIPLFRRLSDNTSSSTMQLHLKPMSRDGLPPRLSATPSTINLKTHQGGWNGKHKPDPDSVEALEPRIIREEWHW